MVTWGDLRPGHLFGFNVVELGNRPPFVKRELLETRPMHAYGLDDAQGLSAAEVLELLGRQAAEVPPDDANCEVMVHGMDPLARQELDQRDVEALFERAAGATYNIQARTVRWDATHAKIVEGEDPRARFAQLVEQSDGDEAFKDEVLTFGSQLLDIAIEQVIEDEVDTNRRAEVVGQ